jgi:hypothetical protein
VSHQPPRCDACDKRIRQNHHYLRLSDLTTGQVIGRYHTRPGCQAQASKYFEPGAVLRFSVVHPGRCGDDFEACDGGLLENGEAA